MKNIKREAHVLWEGKSAHYDGTTAHVHRIVATKVEYVNDETDDVVQVDIGFLLERRGVDALGSPAWFNDGCVDGAFGTALAHFALQGPHSVPEWLRTWYLRQRDLPIGDARGGRGL